MAHPKSKFNTYQSDIEKVSLYILSLYGNFKIPYEYHDTILKYRNRYRHQWKLRINFKKDVKGKKWPHTFDFYQLR